ncbi:PP2C family serine/threonine-protein phosphatase [Alteribacillus iranensis]|uniref:Serine phosphatase n=1 Tax=Alteribacillus iranensis TaxID=930128 RepID=A0A1I2DEK4_9BACI|nr:PP2C family serine/threonine-protein phosphatase [Alteribacillus iranensis]SFE78811.1 serine phosphatase [Alteribacillus iranensis]
MIETKTHANVAVAVYQQGKNGSSWCGDGYITIETDSYFLCALADGLGSGENAARSSELAMEAVKKNQDESVPVMLEACNKALAEERGVVITILKAYFDSNTLAYGNVGNIATYLFPPGEEMKRPIPTTGYLSGRKYKYRMEYYPFQSGFHFVMHSDGIQIPRSDQQWMNRIISPHTSIKQLEKHAKQDDDVTVLIGQVT